MTKRNKDKKVNEKLAEQKVVDAEFEEVIPEEGEEQEPEEAKEEKVSLFKKVVNGAKKAGCKVRDTGKKLLSNKWVKRGFVVAGTIAGVGGVLYLVLKDKSGKTVIVEADNQDVVVAEQDIVTEQAAGSYEDVHGYTPEVEDPIVEEETKPIDEWTAEDLEHSTRDCNE